MKIKIEVTEDDILNGKKGSGCFCPIARAVKRKLIPATYVRVTKHDLVTDYSEIFPASASLPNTAQSFIQAFDAGHKVEPFDFEIEVNDLTPLRID
jgi:hypothetical protein